MAFDANDPAEFLDLVQELRSTESSAYTASETPIFTCLTSSVERALDALDGEPGPRAPALPASGRCRRALALPASGRCPRAPRSLRQGREGAGLARARSLTLAEGLDASALSASTDSRNLPWS